LLNKFNKIHFFLLFSKNLKEKCKNYNVFIIFNKKVLYFVYLFFIDFNIKSYLVHSQVSCVVLAIDVDALATYVFVVAFVVLESSLPPHESAVPILTFPCLGGQVFDVIHS
jgi:hypothetical protein